MRILNYNFEGPWMLGQHFADVPGIYVIYNPRVWLDVGETDKLGQRINDNAHERQSKWIANSNNLQIYIAFLKIEDKELRLSIEYYLRSSLKPICGEK